MFLMNPYGRHFSKMKASDMLLVDAQELSAENAERIDPHSLGYPWGDASQ